MKIEDEQFFFKHYVGYLPEDENVVLATQNMIQHYEDCGLHDFLPCIYEECAKDAMLSPRNIPSKLWEKDNLLDNSKFYFHPLLRITNSAPQYDPSQNKTIEFPYFYEVKERFTIKDLLLYSVEKLNRSNEFCDNKQDVGAIKYLLSVLANTRKYEIEPVDFILHLIDANQGKRISLLDLKDETQNVLEKLCEHKEKLKRMNKMKIVWRGNLNLECLH